MTLTLNAAVLALALGTLAAGAHAAPVTTFGGGTFVVESIPGIAAAPALSNTAAHLAVPSSAPRNASGSGSTIASRTNGCQSCAGTNRYVDFDFGAARFDRIVLVSDGRAFESDNPAFGTVPAPGAFAPLGMGLLAGVSATRRRNA
jgi:hypothetical protein